MLPAFKLLEPNTIEEACRIALDTDGMFLAGATDIFVAMHGGALFPETLISLAKIDALRDIRKTDQGIFIGALTPHRYFEFNQVMKTRYTAIHEGCAQVGSPQIRNRGTIGGNLCNGAPSADSAGPLLVFDAVCVIVGAAYERTLPLREFYLGPKKTALRKGELLKSIYLPEPVSRSASRYIKFTRRNAMDLALLGVSAYLALDDSGGIADARLALTTAGPTPIRAGEAERRLIGHKPCDSLFSEAAAIAENESLPRTSWRSSKEFRLKLVKSLTEKALREAFERI